MKTIRTSSAAYRRLSTMPRPQTEASKQLELYKKLTVRQRLQEELQLIEQRAQDLKQQLTTVDREIMQSEATIRRLRQASSNSEHKTDTPNVSESVKRVRQSKQYQTFHLEY